MVDELPVALSAINVSKHYGGIKALEEVSLEVRAGEVVGLVGDNGAGKSTMLKVIAGVIEPTSGSLAIDGEPVRFARPSDATERGISTVYQDTAVSPQRDVVANFFLGRELVVDNWFGRKLGWLDRKAMTRVTRERLAELRVKIRDLRVQAGDLSGGQRQALTIARAAAWCDRVLLLDEPTSALGVEQHAEVLQLVHEARDSGLAVILVSHQIPDIVELCDRVIVLRLGRVVASLSREEIVAEDLVGYITGAKIHSSQNDLKGNR